MYSKQEVSQLKQEFWTVFGQYMAPVTSADGEKINWINYKTGEKDIAFRMEGGRDKAIVSIQIIHKDPELQQLYFDQFLSMKNSMLDLLPGKWEWKLHDEDEYGKVYSRIFTNSGRLNILEKNDWPELISFFKSNMIALDEFWSSAKYAFELLR